MLMTEDRKPPTKNILTEPVDEVFYPIYAAARRVDERNRERSQMNDFASETDSDYTSYWRDWVRKNEELSVFIIYCFAQRLFALY